MATNKIILGLLLLNLCGHEYLICDASKKYNRYIAHLFNKYGTGGTMSFEGLEHLMYNLGLGGLEFGPKHTIDEHHPNGYKIPDLIIDEGDSMLDEKGRSAIVEDIKNESETLTAIEIVNVPSDYDSKKEVSVQNNQEDTNQREVQNSINVLDVEEDKKILFKEMHDPKHRHPRHHEELNPLAGKRCLSPLAIMKLVIDPEIHHQSHTGIKKASQDQTRTKRHTVTTSNPIKTGVENDEDIAYTSMKITSTAFMKMCPALLVQIEQQVCAQKLVDDEAPMHRGSYLTAWIYASISIFIISCCGLFGVAIVPLAKSTAYQEILKFLVAVAVGTLCGDALMHLLPHALAAGHESSNSTNAHTSHNDPVFICGCAFATAVFMYTVETLLPLIKGSTGHGHGHSHSSGPSSSERQQVITMDTLTDNKHREINTMLDEAKEDEKIDKPLSPVAFMVIIGDGLHNLTDGLAIGAAFAHDPVTGMATSLAVLCHELPHELGDFALLIQTGVHINRAMVLNIVSSILSFVGMAAGLVLAEWEAGMVRWIYAATAGSFLYIALTDLIPEMGRGGERNLKNSMIQIFGIVLGGIIMLVIALHEDHLRTLFN